MFPRLETLFCRKGCFASDGGAQAVSVQSRKMGSYRHLYRTLYDSRDIMAISRKVTLA